MDLVHYHVPKLLQIFVEKRCDIDLNDSIFSGLRHLKFQVNPELLNWQILQALIVKGFHIECDFFLYYQRNSKLIPIENDDDLHRALNSTLQLELIVDLVDYRQLLSMMSSEQKKKKTSNHDQQQLLPFKVLSDWDIITSSDIILAQTLSMTNNFILNQIEKLKTKARCLETISASSMATNSWMVAETIYQYLTSDDPRQEPVADFWPYLDADGRVKSQRDLRVAIYRRGLDPNLRRIGWKHLLNVYPEDYTGQERIDFIRLRCETYIQMRDLWQRNVETDPEVRNICNMVKKDVRRTDRHHPFYMANQRTEETSNSSEKGDPEDQEENPNVERLYNILVTYALNHKYRYCQGMSDLASPLLFVMKDESHAYIAFCALMQRLGENFSTDGEAINRKFSNLKRLLRHYDSEFFRYLESQGADELLFTYRWILLDLKREFPFDQVMEILEVLWASIPSPREANMMNMFDVDFLYVPNKNSSTETSSKPETSFSVRSEGMCKSKLRSLKFLPNMLSSDSQTTITEKPPLISLDSPMQQEWSQNREFPPRPWDSPNLKKKTKNECARIEEAGSAFFSVGTSRFYVDKDYSLPSSSGPSSSASSDCDGDENKFTKRTARNEDVSSIDSGIIHRKIKNRNRKTSSCIHLHHAHCNGDDGSSTTDDEDQPHQREQQQKHDSFSYHSLDHGYITDQKTGISPGMVPRAAELLTEDSDAACTIEAQFNKLSAEVKSVSEQELNDAIQKIETLQVTSIPSPASSTSSSIELLPGAGDLDMIGEDFSLISPDELGANDAFMLFVCLTMLLQSRNHIMSQEMDRNDIQMYFDNMVRKHNVRTVLEDARHMFHEYLIQWRRDERLDAQD